MSWLKFRLTTKFIPVVLTSCAALLATPSSSMGQAELATFRGKVTDVEGTPLEGAVVRFKDLARGTELEVETDKNGSFYRRGLRPSEYELTIEKEGYLTFQVELRMRAGEEKREDFRLMPAMSPAEAAFQRGIEAFNSRDYEAAAKAFAEVVELSPETPEGHSNLGVSYLQLGRNDEAIQQFEKAAELSPESFNIWTQLAMVYGRVDRFDDATRAFETALSKQHDPNDPSVRDSWMALGTLYFSKGKVKEAMDAFEKILAKEPNAPDALSALGKCYFNQGDTAKALELFKQLVAAAPDSPEATEAKTFIQELESAAANPP